MAKAFRFKFLIISDCDSHYEYYDNIPFKISPKDFWVLTLLLSVFRNGIFTEKGWQNKATGGKTLWWSFTCDFLKLKITQAYPWYVQPLLRPWILNTVSFGSLTFYRSLLDRFTGFFFTFMLIESLPLFAIKDRIYFMHLVSRIF